jgi:IS1 family transposase/transposase-like protein
MIQETITYTCTGCGSTNIVKNGKDYKGSQKFYCHDCHKYGTLQPQGRAYSQRFRDLAFRIYWERASMRGVARVLGIARKTFARWIREAAENLPPLADTLEDAQPEGVLELDELWSFVLKKSNKRWIWVALCRHTRQVVAYFVGDRSEASCRQLWERIPAAYRQYTTFSDFWSAYQKVFAEGRHHSVGKETGETAHVERWNNTLRQRLGRFVRKTLSFSKSDTFHEAVLKLYLHYYNTVWCHPASVKM